MPLAFRRGRAGQVQRKSLSFDPKILGFVVAAMLVAPLLALIALSVQGDLTYFTHIAQTRLATFSVNSLLLVLLAGGGAAIVGTGLAFAANRYHYPGKAILEWALVLPLAMPAYIAAYSWYDLTAPGGTLYLATEGLFPRIRGVGGAALVFAFTLYPYVYLLVRNALAMNGEKQREIARSLGATKANVFWRVDLPSVWPAAFAGAALVGMEVLADYGVADFLGVPTFTVGIVRAWSSFGDPAAAAQLAIVLLLAALLTLGAERLARSRRRFGSGAGEKRGALTRPLDGWKGWLLLGAMLVPVAIGLLVPLANLVALLLETRPARPVWPAFVGSLSLALVSAVLAVCVGVLGAYMLRAGGRLGQVAVRVAQAGYAVPGAVAAIGVLAALFYAQMAIDRLGLGGVLAVTGGSVFALVLAYQARFAAVAVLPCETALQSVRRELDEAARSLGLRANHVITRVHLPIIMPAMMTAALLVGIEVIKELPATMILRPFTLDTLAVSAHNYASDERLAQAALPALLLLAISIPATAWLHRMRGKLS